MPRGLTSDFLYALSQPIIQPAIFIEVTFGTISEGVTTQVPVRLWSGVGTTTWNGFSWIGMGTLMSITSPEDSSSVEAKGITLEFSGLDPNLLPTALNNVILGLPITVWLMLYNTSGDLIDTPVVMWSGRVDRPTWTVDGKLASLSLNCENRLLDMNVSAARRLTLQDAQMDFPGDLGLSFVASLQECNYDWGGTEMTTNTV
jgi:hypothetical protein